jgi:hypothetical protein
MLRTAIARGRSASLPSSPTPSTKRGIEVTLKDVRGHIACVDDTLDLHVAK